MTAKIDDMKGEHRYMVAKASHDVVVLVAPRVFTLS